MATGAAFTPEEVQVLVLAYEGCCKKMGFKPQNDALTQAVAKTVIQVGKFGATRPDLIQKQVLLLLRGSKAS
jgi:hypothetical protein